MSVVPAPLPIAPSKIFDGDDGNWSSFTVKVGEPPQDVRVLVSTLVPETWVVLAAGCSSGDSTCSNSRGGLFEPSKSTTWVDQGTWTLVEETALGYGGTSDPGDYGFDSLGIQPIGNANGGITLPRQVIAALAVKDFYLGNLGLNPRTPQVNASTQPSFLQSLRSSNDIPSLSYGYTAGAYYRNETYGSLTLGGYDASRFITNDVSFSLSTVEEHDLVVGLQSITYSDSNTEGSPLISYGDGFLALIDSTLPNIWLPLSACDAFATAFGLTFNSLKLIYIINSTMHDANIKNNASVTFQLGNLDTGGAVVNITLPYASFDLNFTTNDPNVSNTTAYFPLRQAQQNTQYTLGRAFLQEAYLIVDYERKNFSVSQCDFSGKPSHIVAISSVNATDANAPGASPSPSATPSGVAGADQNSSSGLSSGAIAGLAIGIIVLAIILASAVLFILWRKRKARGRHETAAELPGDDLEGPTKTHRSSTLRSSSSQTKWYFNIFGSQKSTTATSRAEHDGKEISSPQRSQPHHTTDGPMQELSAGDVQQRAELHSPEPGENGSVSPQLSTGEPGLPIYSNHPGAESPEQLPSPTTEPPSAFQSPRIPNAFSGRLPPEGVSPGADLGGLSPESEKDGFKFHYATP